MKRFTEQLPQVSTPDFRKVLFQCPHCWCFLQFGLSSITEEPELALETPKSSGSGNRGGFGGQQAHRPSRLSASLELHSEDEEGEYGDGEEKPTMPTASPPGLATMASGDVQSAQAFHTAVYPDTRVVVGLDGELGGDSALETDLNTEIEPDVHRPEDATLQAQHSKRVAKSEGQRQGRLEPSLLRCSKIQLTYHEEVSGYYTAPVAPGKLLLPAAGVEILIGCSSGVQLYVRGCFPGRLLCLPLKRLYLSGKRTTLQPSPRVLLVVALVTPPQSATALGWIAIVTCLCGKVLAALLSA
jgi:hypothetical protein